MSKPIDAEALEKTLIKYLPKELIEKRPKEEVIELEKDLRLPEELVWLYDVKGLSVDDGIKANAGVLNYIMSVKLFYETIDDNAEVIKNAYDNGDIKLFTIKVHALKSSARIVGALGLSDKCAKMEEAGNKEDLEYIESHKEDLFNTYAEFKTSLKQLETPLAEDTKDKELIDENELSDAINALKELVEAMDYDGVETVLNGLDEYKLPENEAALIKEFTKFFRQFDWDGMESTLNKY